MGKFKIPLAKCKSVRYNVHIIKTKEAAHMTTVNITNFRKNVFGFINQAIEFNDIVSVNTKNGNAVIMSEEDYNGIMETLYVSSIPGLKEDIIEGMKTPVSECISESEVEW